MLCPQSLADSPLYQRGRGGFELFQLIVMIYVKLNNKLE